MSIFHLKTTRKLSLIRALKLCSILVILLLLTTTFACKKNVDYFAYVSELRNNIFLAEKDGFALRIYSVIKESPYAADGIVRETSARTEIYLIAPDCTQNYDVRLHIDDKEYGGELSYDNVKSEYYLFFTLDIASQTEISCTLTYPNTRVEFTAKSVLNTNMVAPNDILKSVIAYDNELFESMTDKYGFKGEIYLRLLYEEAPYYYVGIINRNGDIYAFLINATTGKVLAKRSPQ